MPINNMEAPTKNLHESFSDLDLWALAPGAVARGFFRDPRTGRSTAKKGVGDGAFAQGGAGASASDRCSNTPSQQPETAESCLI